jgi:hypothetical protein
VSRRAWLRLYCCILDNGKVRNLAVKDQLMFIWCLCLHKEERLAGRSPGQIAYSLRLPEKDVAGRLERLVKANLLLADYTPKGWTEYQNDDYSTPRTQKHRAKKARLAAGTAWNGDGTDGNGDGTDGNGDGTDGNIGETGEHPGNVEESRGEESRGDESHSPADMLRILGELRDIGGEWSKLTDQQVMGIYQSYPRADWDETVRALRMDYGAGGRIPITSNVQKELRKYAATSEIRAERASGDQKQRPPWERGDETDRLREKAAAAAAARQKNGGV